MGGPARLARRTRGPSCTIGSRLELLPGLLSKIKNMARLQRSFIFESEDLRKNTDLRERCELSLFAKKVFNANVDPANLHYNFPWQWDAGSVPEIPRALIETLMRKVQLYNLYTKHAGAIHLIPPNTPLDKITEDDARVVLVAHRLFASGGVGLEHWMSLAFTCAKKMPLHPSAQGYNPAFVGHEDLWMVSSDNISPKKLATTAKVYESKIAEQLSSTYIQNQARQVLEAIDSHCSYDGEKLALAKALLNRVISECGEGFIDLDSLKCEAAGMRSTRFQNKSREELAEAVGRIPTAHGFGDAKRAKHKPKSSVLPVSRKRDATAPSNFTLGQRGTYERVVNLWLQLSGAGGDADLWMGYAGFLESAQQENYEKLRRRIRRVLDGVLNGFKLHKANKLSKKLFRLEKTLAKLEAKMLDLKDNLVDAEHAASQQKARAAENFRHAVANVSAAREDVEDAKRSVHAERNKKAKVAMEDGLTLRFPEREENETFLEGERVEGEKRRLFNYVKKNVHGYAATDWSSFYEAHVESGPRPELHNHSVAQIVDPRETWERISDPRVPDTAARRDLFKTKCRNLHVAQCRAGELVFPEFNANFEKIRDDLSKLGIACGDMSDDFDEMRARAEAAAERVETLGVADDTAMLDDSSEDEGSDSELQHDAFPSQIMMTREQQQHVARTPSRDEEDSDDLESVVDDEEEETPSMYPPGMGPSSAFDWSAQPAATSASKP